MLDWLTHDSQADAAANLYIPLPIQARQLTAALARVNGPGGRPLAG